MKGQKIIVDGQEITIKKVNEEEYISLTDIAKYRTGSEPRDTIRNWLNNGSTLRFLEAWELMHNENFKRAQMDPFRITLADGRTRIRIQHFIKETQAIGIESRAGRYGGTYAHKDIAFEFASWVEPVFKLFIIKEFQRLKSEEAERLNLEYNETRLLTKVNYTLQTKAIEENILPRLHKTDKHFAYSSEADLLNKVVFGMTAKQWRENFPDLKGNIRDHASLLELNILNNLQSRNAELIDNGVEAELRFRVLLQIAQKQFQRLADDKRLTPPDELIEP